MEISGAGGPETLAGIVLVPDVEVADLGALGGGDADDGAGGGGPGAAGTDWNRECLGADARSFLNGGIEFSPCRVVEFARFGHG